MLARRRVVDADDYDDDGPASQRTASHGAYHARTDTNRVVDVWLVVLLVCTQVYPLPRGFSAPRRPIPTVGKPVVRIQTDRVRWLCWTRATRRSVNPKRNAISYPRDTTTV